MSTSPIIYSLVSKGNDTILSSYTQYNGNFQQVALQILHRYDLSKKFSQFETTQYRFYAYCIQGFVFLVMVGRAYEMKLAYAYLIGISDKFFNIYNAQQRNNIQANSFTDFNNALKYNTQIYNNKYKVDGTPELKKQLGQLQKSQQKKEEKMNQLQKDKNQ